MKKLNIVLMVAIAALMLVVPQFLKNYGIYLLTYWLIFIIATMA
jgi:branched-chain amino acid transport system permease protein